MDLSFKLSRLVDKHKKSRYKKLLNPLTILFSCAKISVCVFTMMRVLYVCACARVYVLGGKSKNDGNFR